MTEFPHKKDSSNSDHVTGNQRFFDLQQLSIELAAWTSQEHFSSSNRYYTNYRFSSIVCPRRYQKTSHSKEYQTQLSIFTQHDAHLIDTSQFINLTQSAHCTKCTFSSTTHVSRRYLGRLNGVGSPDYQPRTDVLLEPLRSLLMC